MILDDYRAATLADVERHLDQWQELRSTLSPEKQHHFDIFIRRLDDLCAQIELGLSMGKHGKDRVRHFVEKLRELIDDAPGR